MRQSQTQYAETIVRTNWLLPFVTRLGCFVVFQPMDLSIELDECLLSSSTLLIKFINIAVTETGGDLTAFS